MDDWEKKFDETWKEVEYSNFDYIYGYEDIKSFIRTLLEERAKTSIDLVESTIDFVKAQCADELEALKWSFVNDDWGELQKVYQKKDIDNKIEEWRE